MATTDNHWLYTDQMAAIKEYLNQYYTNTNEDVADLIRRYLQERTANDSTRAWIALNAGARGDEVS